MQNLSAKQAKCILASNIDLWVLLTETDNVHLFLICPFHYVIHCKKCFQWQKTPRSTGFQKWPSHLDSVFSGFVERLNDLV